MLRSDADLQKRVTEQAVYSLRELPEHPEPRWSSGVGEMAFTYVVVTAAETEVPTTPRQPCPRRWRETIETAAVVNVELHETEEVTEVMCTGSINRVK